MGAVLGHVGMKKTKGWLLSLSPVGRLKKCRIGANPEGIAATVTALNSIIHIKSRPVRCLNWGDSMDKCSFGDGVTIKPDGENELDPCFYETVETYRNVTVKVLRCTKCGHIELNWYMQDNTEVGDADG